MKNYITRRERGCSESTYETWESPRETRDEPEEDWRYYTCKQTTVINHPNCSRELYGFELRPVCPMTPLKNEVVSVYYREKVRGITFVENETIWYPDGVIVRTDVDGVKTTWYPKPTLQDAITGPREDGRFRYFRFKGDTVEAFFYNGTYFWTANWFEAQDEPGDVSIGRVGEDGKVIWDKEDDCGCHNSYRCCGYDPADNGRD